MTQHLSDGELLRYADGELPEAAAHLEGCWLCRDRLRAIESTLAELTPAIPPANAARAQLQSRLANQDGFRLPFVTPARVAFACLLVGIVVLFQTTVSADGPKPKPSLTPGDTRPITLAEVCRERKAEVIVRDIPEAMQRAVFAEYGIRNNPREAFEVDYLITPDLGGSPSIRNLWPEPYSTRWNARVKDDLEQRLHNLVCSGQVPLATAQHDIASDWIAAYRKYFHSNQPLPDSGQ